MPNKYYLPFIIFSFLYFGCNSNEIESDTILYEKDFPKAIELKGSKYDFEQILNPRGLILKDQYAIVYELKNTSDQKFHVIDLESEKFLHSKGKDGLGPGETTMIYTMYDVGIDRKVFAYDVEQRMFYQYDILDSLSIAEKQFRSAEMHDFITQAAFTSDTSLITNLVDGRTQYFIINLKGEVKAAFGDWFDLVKNKDLPNGYKITDLDPNLISTLGQGPLKANKKGNKAVKAGLAICYFDIIDIKTQEVKRVYGPELELPNFSISNSGGYQMAAFDNDISNYYTDVYVGSDSFFLLYFGKLYSKRHEETNLNKVFEFDFNGKIMKQYQLDYELKGITVDETNKILYGVTADREPNLIKFKFE